MGFAGQGGGVDGSHCSGLRAGPAGALEAIEVVDDAGGGVAEQALARSACGSASVEEAVDLRLRQVGVEAGQRVALDRCWQRLAHHRGADHHAQRVERHLGPVAVGVGDQPRLQHAVVVAVARVDAVAQRVAGFDHQQVVGVEVDDRVSGRTGRGSGAAGRNAAGPAPARCCERVGSVGGRRTTCPDGIHQWSSRVRSSGKQPIGLECLART